MIKKSVSDATTSPDSPDNFWLASIARRNTEMQVTETTAIPVAVVKPTAQPASSPVSGHHSYPPAPVDSFWLKYGDARREAKAPDRMATGHVDQIMDMRVGIPATVSYNASLHDGKSRHAVWAIRNMSLGGVFLEMGVSDLQEGAIVEFLLRYQHNGKSLEHRLSAKVVRVQLNGLALRFDYYDGTTCNQLYRLLYSC